MHDEVFYIWQNNEVQKDGLGNEVVA